MIIRSLDCASGLAPKAPAAFVVAWEGFRLLLDFGRVGGQAPDPARLGRIDAVALSHGHADHAGALDLLPRIGAPPVFATAHVAASVGVATARPLPLRGRVRIGPFAVETGRSGHAPGGVWLCADAGDGAVLYCGDVVPDGPAYPFDPPPAADTVILDASCGDGPAGDRTEAVDRALGRPGPVLLPAPADGRGAEIALALREAGRTPRLCPRTRTILQATVAGTDCLRPVASAELASLLAAPEPGGAGVTLMHDATLADAASADEAEAIEAAGGLVLFTGVPREGTPGRARLEAGRAELARWPTHPTIEQNAALVVRTGARRVVPAFCDAETAQALARRFDLPLAGWV